MEAFHSVSQFSYIQRLQLGISGIIKTIKINKHKSFPAASRILIRRTNGHRELVRARKGVELVIWASVHLSYPVFHDQSGTYSSLRSDYLDDFRQIMRIYSQEVGRYGEKVA